MFLITLPLAATAATPLPLADNATSQMLLRSGADTVIPLAAGLDACTLRYVGLLNPQKGQDPRQAQLVVESKEDALSVRLERTANLEPGSWTLQLQGEPTPDAVEQPEEGALSCRQLYALVVDVPAAKLRPIEARVELTRITPVTFDLPAQDLWDKVHDLVCRENSYPQCVDSAVPVSLQEVGGARHSCDWSAAVSVERWGTGINADLPAGTTWRDAPEDKTKSFCVEPGDLAVIDLQLPDNIPLGTSELTLHLRSATMPDPLAVPVVVNVRRDLVWLFLATIAGAAFKLVHQSLLPALRDALALKRHIQQMQQVAAVAGGHAPDRSLLDPLLNRRLLSLMFYLSDYTTQARDAHELLKKTQSPNPEGLEEREHPQLPPFPTEHGRPWAGVFIETALGVFLLCVFVYVSYAPTFVGTPAELAALLTFAYAANLGLDPLMTDLTQRVGNLVQSKPPAKPTTPAAGDEPPP